MANLETLELTISGNAEQATQGIGKLITSLGFLDKAVGKSVSGLMRLNAELKTLKGYGALKLPNIGKATGARAVSASARKVVGTYDVANNNGRGYIVPSLTEEQIRRSKEWDEQLHKNASEDYKRKHIGYSDWAKQRREELGWKDMEKVPAGARLATPQEIKQYGLNQREATEAVKETTEAVKEDGKALDETKVKTAELADETKKASKEMSTSIKAVTKSSHGLLSTIGRIFKTMLIRTAIRALLKAAKEGLDNYYHYASQMGLAFGTSMDKIYSKWTQLKNQLGAAIGSALVAVLPILQKIISLAVTALNAITAIFALLSGKTTYSAAQEGMDSYANSMNNASKAAKQWLASFDELNVITKDSSGGGGSSGGQNWGNMFKELELPQWMIEWKPIIEAVLAGVLGAVILPKIVEWVKKLFGLFNGNGASVAQDLLNKLFGKDSKFPEQPNYQPFPTQPAYAPFPTAPDYTKLAADWGVFAVATTTASTALPIVTAELGKIAALIQGFSAISAVIGAISALIAGLANKKIAVEVDRKQFDEFKKDYDDWKKNDINPEIEVRIYVRNAMMTVIDEWCDEIGEKRVNIVFVDDAGVYQKLSDWIAKTETKHIKVNVETDIKQSDPKNNNSNNKQGGVWGYIKEQVENIYGWIEEQFVGKKQGGSAKEIDVNVEKLIDFTGFDTMSEAQRKQFVTSIFNAYGSNTALEELKRAIPNISVNGVISITDWQSFTNDEKLEFLNSLKKVFGEKKTIQAAKDAGINLGKLVSEGMTSSDPLIKSSAQAWNKIIDDNMKDPTVSVVMDKKSAENAGKELSKIVQDKLTSSYPVKVRADDSSVAAFGKKITDEANKARTVTITVNIANNMATSVANAFTDAIKNAFQHLKVSFDKDGNITVTKRANGGFVEKGQLFIAGERGAELVGSMGNKTAVANGDQIVDGIAAGVASANAEQNALLRRQNEILIGILNKNMNVNIGASSGLGRVVSQSLDMYGMMVGR